MRNAVLKFLFTVLIATLTRNAAAAQTSPHGETHRSTAFDACMNSGDAAKGITVGMLDCIHDEIHRQDMRLNRTYRALMARLVPVRRRKLQTSERDWIKQREIKCANDARSQEGGTTWLLIYNQCIAGEEESRADYLEHYR